MKTKLTIKIKKRSQPGWLCWLIIVLPFLFGTLNDLLGLPWIIRYLLDIAWFALLLLMVVHRGRLEWRNTRGLIAWTVLFLVYTALAYLPQYQSGLYYLWGLRNDFRFYAAFFAFGAFLSRQDVDDFFRLFDKLFWLNVVVSLVQFFLLEKDGDHLGGLFGVEGGTNGYTNIFFCITLTRSVVIYLSKTEKLSACVWKFIAAIIVAALAEMKFFFVEAVLIVVFAVLITDFSWRNILIIVGGFVGILAGAMLLVQVFPNFAGFFTWEWMLENAISDKGYTSSGDLNRLNAIPVINELWLTNGWKQIFGFGLGNCDTSGFAIVNTPFFERFGDLHYTWLSYAMMYLECGWIGLIFYFGFFVLVYFKIRRIEKNCIPTVKAYCRIARIMAVLCVVISVYNSSLRTEAGYMAYFVLAVPFAAAKTGSENHSCKQ